MKGENTVLQSDSASREANQFCCIARLNALLKSIRAKHDGADAVRQIADARVSGLLDVDLPAPSLRDIYAAELEASVAPEACAIRARSERTVIHDSPQEIARARLVLTATLMVPLLLIAAGLALFDGQLGRASTSLLQFSTLALATPLILALTRTAIHSGWKGMRRHPVLALTGVVAAGGYTTSAFAMSGPDPGMSSVLALSIVGLLVVVVQLGHWLFAHKTSI